MAIKLYYDREKNDENEAMSIPGVPLRDITEDEYKRYPRHIQKSLEASDLYRVTNPAPQSRKADATKSKPPAGRITSKDTSSGTGPVEIRMAPADGQKAENKPAEGKTETETK